MQNINYLKSIVLFIYSIGISINSNAQFSIHMSPIIPGTSPGVAYVLYETPPVDIGTIFWEGPNGFVHIGGFAHPISEPGEYCVTIVNAENCIAEGCITVPLCEYKKYHGLTVLVCNERTIKNPPQPLVGGSGGKDVFDISAIYPNPFQDNLTVKIQSPIDQIGIVKIVSSDGVILMDFNVELFQGENQFSYSFENGLPIGLYSLIAIDANGIVKAKQIVKQ
jgi:hypothetical protein